MSLQVAQSMASSLEHLGTDYVDSYVLHGPSCGYEWTDADAEVWEAMRKERDAGRARLAGRQQCVTCSTWSRCWPPRQKFPPSCKTAAMPACGWDREVRAFCRKHKIIYQGFSLLTANAEVLRHPLVVEIATTCKATPAQIVFSFSRAVGMLPLTGTSNAEHMKQDLASRDRYYPPESVKVVESIAG